MFCHASVLAAAMCVGCLLITPTTLHAQQDKPKFRTGQYKRIHQNALKMITSGKADKAIRYLVDYDALNPDDAETYFMLAAAYSATGKKDQANGYWTLAVRSHLPAVLVDIDWGSADVYDQTRRRATAAGLVVQTLPVWHDVDRPEDVDALRLRLRLRKLSLKDGPSLMETAPLRRLAEQLDRLCSSRTPREGTPS